MNVDADVPLLDAEYYELLARSLVVPLPLDVIPRRAWDDVGLVRRVKRGCKHCNGTGFAPLTRESALLDPSGAHAQIALRGVQQCTCTDLFLRRRT